MVDVAFEDERVVLWHGDCLDVLKRLTDASVDAVVTDPPYGLEFMGKDWDRLGNIGKASHAGWQEGQPERYDHPHQRGTSAHASYSASANVKCLRCDRWKWAQPDRKCACGLDAVWPNVKALEGKRMQEWHEAWAVECLRVLRPGGHLLAFGGTRTWHRLTCAIEDAGFEIRDTITWLYGSGFPKSLDVSKAIDRGAGAEREVVGYDATRARPNRKYEAGAIGNIGGSGIVSDRTDNGATLTAPATEDAARWQGWGTALKPASEPVVVARKPLAGTVAATVVAHGTGALNIDGCRVEGHYDPAGRKSQDIRGGRSVGAPAVRLSDQPQECHAAGRWPSNVVLTHAQAVDGGDACADGCVPGCPVADLDAQSGPLHTQDPATRYRASDPSWSPSGTQRGTHRESKQVTGGLDEQGTGASRFFPSFRYQAKAPTRERPKVDGVAHPTVKPLALMSWLVRLVTPPDGTVLDPFAGSGTTVEAALAEGFRCVAVEREAEYLPLILARIERQPKAVPAPRGAAEPMLF